jgi:hypothetical protein
MSATPSSTLLGDGICYYGSTRGTSLEGVRMRVRDRDRDVFVIPDVQRESG